MLINKLVNKKKQEVLVGFEYPFVCLIQLWLTVENNFPKRTSRFSRFGMSNDELWFGS
jgi:hypothetical protein